MAQEYNGVLEVVLTVEFGGQNPVMHTVQMKPLQEN